MSFRDIPPGLWIGPPLMYMGFAPGAGAVAIGTMDAATEKCAIFGHMWWADHGTHTISSAGGLAFWHVHNPVTFNNGATNLRGGLQDLHASNFPTTPDGTFDTQFDLTGGTDTITPNTFRSTALESGSKSVAHGAKLAFVLDMTARSGSDSVLMGAMPSTGNPGFPGARPFNTSAWQTPASGAPSLVLVADDGTLGTFIGCFPYIISGSSGDTFQDTTNPDEVGNTFTPTFDCKVDSFRTQLIIDNAADDFTFDIFSDPFGSPASLIGGPITVVPEHFVNNSGSHEYLQCFAPVTLKTGTVYGYAIKSTGTSTITVPLYHWGAAGHSALGLFSPHRITRNGGSGVYTDTTTTQLSAMWLGLSAVRVWVPPTFAIGGIP